MILGMLGGIKPMLLMGTIICIMVAGFYWYYTDTQKRLAILHANAAKLEIAIETQQKTIKSYQEDIKFIELEKMTVEQEFEKSRKETDDLRKKFNKVSKLVGARDIGKLGIARPTAIEKVISSGTNEILRCFELSSGAEPTEEEKNAIKPSEINQACPDLANPQYIPVN